MRISFFDSSAEELTSQRKGHLFEQLASRLIRLSGYIDVQLRVKHASLEYDLEAKHNLNGRILMGEAKAHESNITGQDVAAFVGKLVPHSVSGEIDGLFISTSPFTAEAKDYLSTLPAVSSQLPFRFRTLVGNEIPLFLLQQGQCVSEEILRARVADLYGFDALDTWLVGATYGDFLVATYGPNPVGAATHFATFDLNGGAFTLDEQSVICSCYTNYKPIRRWQELDTPKSTNRHYRGCCSHYRRQEPSNTI